MLFALFRKTPPARSPEEIRAVEAEELKKVIEKIDKVSKEKDECTMCTFVLIFALTLFLIIAFFVFIFRLDDEVAFGPLPPEKTPPPHDIERKEQDLVATSALPPGYYFVKS